MSYERRQLIAFAPRRGIAALALVIILAMLSLTIVGMILCGARDQDLTVSRLETIRAMYASEGGAEMAMRELITNTDADGDGAIGSVSNDGNSANNPTIGGASVYVDRTVSGSTATLTVRGSTSVARRAMQMTVTSGSAAGSPMVIYGEDPTKTPVMRTWSGSAWTAESSTLDIGGKPRWVVAAACPTRNEVAAMVCDNLQDLNVMIYNGTSWGNQVEVSTNIGTTGDRPISLAYEQSSGDLLIAYRNSGGSTIYYRTWNGTSWSGALTTANVSSGSLRFLRLIPKPGSDQIMLLSLDDNKDLTGMVWDGSTWGNKILLDTGTQTSSEECMAAAYETLSGDAVVVWARLNQDNPRYRVYNSGGWGAESVGPNMGAPAHWVNLASDPSSDRVMMLTLDDDKDVNASLWSGTAWGAVTEFEIGSPVFDRRDCAVAFEPAGTRAVAIYAEATVESPRYRVFDGTNWSSELTGPDLGDDFAAFSLTPMGSGQEIFALALNRAKKDALQFLRWNGTSFVNAVELEANTAGSDTHEAFSMIRRNSTAATVTGLTAVSP